MSRALTHVLLVDDDPDARGALARLLVGEGIHVDAAENGRVAMELASRAVPDVVVSDLQMPEMDGLGLLRALRARQLDVPVILVTGVEDVGSAVGAMRSGAADYLTKPVDADALLFSIERALKTRELLSVAAALRAKNEALTAESERNVRAREELLSIVAHDLRGPLGTIDLAVSVARSENDPVDVARGLAVVERASARMSRLVEDLLDVTRIETGSLALDLAPQSASAVLREAMSAVGSLAAKSGVRLESFLSSDFRVHCAFERIVQALVNLASNAIRVTARGKSVRLRVERRGQRARFQIEDDGPGIPSEQLPRMFERGFSSTGGRRGGAGLGLAIVKGIVEAHRGSVAVETALGIGTTIHFEIPVDERKHTSWQVAR
jgi:two-component system, sensor histidine kinase and response regulator